MAKKSNSTFGDIIGIDLSGLQNINEPAKATPVPEPVRPKTQKTANTAPKPKTVKATSPQTDTEGAPVLLKSRRDRLAEEVKNKSPKPRAKKMVHLHTEKEQVDLFKQMALQYYLRTPSSFVNYSAMLRIIIRAMEQEYAPIIEATESDLAFYKTHATKNFDHQDLDLITTKEKLPLVFSQEEYDLLYNLMHTHYTRLPVKPTRYSVNFFFFEIMRFFQKNAKKL